MLKTIPLILLIILVYVFRLELYMAGTRFYTLVAENPKFERILGDYYEDAAQKNGYLASNIYDASLKKYKSQLNTAPESMKSEIQYSIGLYYECGKGIKVDLAEAKKWYDEAAKSDKASPAVQQALARINQGAPANATATPGAPTNTPPPVHANQADASTTPKADIPACNLTSEIPPYLK